MLRLFLETKDHLVTLLKYWISFQKGNFLLKSRSLNRVIPGLPAISVEAQLAQALRCIDVRLQVCVAVCTSITSLARLLHQIR